MKNVFVLTLLAVGAMASAAITVPNADFENGTYVHWTGNTMPNNWDAYWNSIDAWGSASSVYAGTDGSNNYIVANVDGTDALGGFAVAFTAEIALAGTSVSAGDTVSLQADIMALNGLNGGGVILKMESWAGGVLIAGSDIETPIGGITDSWAPYSIDYTIWAGADAVKVVLGTSTGWGWANETASSYAFDTISVVPEPATLSLLGLGALSVFRRRRSSI